MRSNQPSPEHLKTLADNGVKTILNLRGPADKGYYLLEKDACEQLGMTLLDYRIFSRDTPKREAIHDLKRIFSEIEYPALMHCKSGADRTGLAGVLFKHFQLGQPISEALEQLRLRYLHVRQGKTGMIDFFFEEFIRYETEPPFRFNRLRQLLIAGLLPKLQIPKLGIKTAFLHELVVLA